MCHRYAKPRETEDTAEETTDDTAHEEQPARTLGGLIEGLVKVLKQVAARLG